MAATKPTASLRDRRLSPSSSLLHHSSASRPARPNPPAPLSRGTTTSPPALSKKAVPNYLKPKASPLSEPPPRRASSATSTTTTTTNKTPSSRRPADKPPSSSTGAPQRSPKPASPTSRPSSSSRLNGDKVISRVTRSARSSPAPKSKSTIKKKEAPATIAAASSPGKLSSDHEFDMGIERTDQEHLKSKPETVVEASNELKNVEATLFVGPRVERENCIEEWKGGGHKNLEDRPDPQMHNETPKEPVVFEEILKLGWMSVAATAGEKRDEGKIGEAKVMVASRRVEPEARKLRLGTAVATVVSATPMKKKDMPVSNDVIEETKSKLMGTRKNRVLALVGAFETVISLQEPEVQQNQKAYQLQQDQQIQEDQQVEVSLENQPSQVQHDQQIQQGQNEDSLENQQSQAQHEQQIQQVQQVGESLENQQDQQGHEGQHDYEAKNDQQLEGGDDEVHQDQQSGGNDQHQGKEEEGVDAMLKEEEEVEVLMLKEEEGENAMLIEEEAHDVRAVESGKAELEKLSAESM